MFTELAQIQPPQLHKATIVNRKKLAKINEIRAEINNLQYQAIEIQKQIDSLYHKRQIVFANMSVNSAQLEKLLNEQCEEFEKYVAL